ncbi:hypothetical protein RB195_002560 [Necator americanus]|uniref:Uncharacterized protein n=1 Tax=Necator americanus TaxID=51031 RepID=A0ABR1DL47_NECAM
MRTARLEGAVPSLPSIATIRRNTLNIPTMQSLQALFVSSSLRPDDVGDAIRNLRHEEKPSLEAIMQLTWYSINDVTKARRKKTVCEENAETTPGASEANWNVLHAEIAQRWMLKFHHRRKKVNAWKSFEDRDAKTVSIISKSYICQHAGGNGKGMTRRK